MTDTAAPFSAQAEPTPAVVARPGALRLALVALALGGWAALLLVGQPRGLNAPVFTLTTVLALFGLAALERLRPAWRNVWLVVPLVFFAVMLAVRAEPQVSFFNLLVVLLLGVLVAHLFSHGELLAWGLFDHVGHWLMAGIAVSVVWPIQTLVWALTESRQTGPHQARLLAVLRGLLLAVPIVAVFTALLTSADAAFNQWVSDALRYLSLDDIGELVQRVVVMVLVGWGSLGLLAYALRGETAPTPAPSQPLQARWLGFTETAIILLAVDVLFAAFVAAQLRYFFGGQSNINVAGFTYSDYARRGFMELLTVALFTLGLGLALQTFAQRRTRRAALGFKTLVTLMAGLTGIMLVSAFLRLQLYEAAYGFTQLRVYAHVFMVWVGVLLGVFIYSAISDQPRRFVFGVLLAGLGFVASLNLLNTDALIARENLQRYAAGGELDAAYLATLSDDALPVLLPLLADPNEDVRLIIGSALHYRLNELTAREAEAGWPGWHLARAQALTLLEARRAELEQYEARRYDWDWPLD